MDRQFYIDLGRSGLRMPIGTDLILHEREDPEAVAEDGLALGQVIEEAARRYGTPLAFGHMDLALEKTALLEVLGVPAEKIPFYHFAAPPEREALDRARSVIRDSSNRRLRAHIESVAYVARQTDLVPVGMGIGPFSLMTKLLADPITPVYLAGSGVTGEEDPDVQTMEAALALALEMVLAVVTAQVEAGAKAVFIAEPAANVVYVSPKQMEAGSDVFDRYVGRVDRRLKALLAAREADLIFHCCGELTDDMVRAFAALDPAILSLGSSRKLWEDARLVPDRTVLFGNLPSKHFHSDAVITRDGVRQLTCELERRMRATSHPFILGSECDVLSVPGSEKAIRDKVETFVRCTCE
jgi:uroporphyrinogen-III decarboxylase